METPEELTDNLRELCAAGTREQLLARGLARGMIWESAVLPEGSPNFSSRLTNDLLNHGYLILGCAIRLRSLSLEQDIPNANVLDNAFLTAAECIEAVVRRGEQRNDRDFHLTIAAAAFHLAHYGARSFSLLAKNSSELNLVSIEKLLVALMQRRLGELEQLCLGWLSDERFTDESIAASLEAEDGVLQPETAAYLAISRVFHQSISTFEFALRTGQPQFVDSTIEMLDRCIEAANQLKHVPLWWMCVLARHLIDDLWGRSLHETLPVDPDTESDWNRLRTDFIELLCRRSIAEIDLWPSQLSAAQRVIDESDSLVVALPTSSGKTRIAELCILKCLSGGRRVIYVTPLRALSAQVEQTLGRSFKPLGFSVTSVYGASGVGASDVDTMKSANLVVATPEKLDFAIRQDPEVIDDVGLIVLDEGHMIGLSEREIRYEVLVQRLLRRPDAGKRRIACLSAIFTEGEAFSAFTQWIRSDRDGDAIRSTWRPTRQRPATLEWKNSGGWLEYRVVGETVYVPRFIEEQPAKKQRKKPFPKNQSELVIAAIERFTDEGHSVLLYCPIRKSVEPAAEEYLKMVRQGYAQTHLSGQAEIEIAKAIRIGEEWLGSGHVALRALRLGVAVHHGQLPRPFLAELESLLRRRILTVAISSPTLAQGVDLSFGVLVFKSLWRNRKLLPAKEFANVIGRVGRAFVDLDGIFLLPVQESNSNKKEKRLSEFHQLVADARSRELESGLFMLIEVCLIRLREQLNVNSEQLNDYVLNQQSAIDTLPEGDDEHAEQMEIILAELDAGIFSLVEDLDCDASKVAAKLDDALNNSLWKRRLVIRGIDEQTNQVAMLHGRATYIWSKTNTSQRQGFFSASIGMESGLQLIDQGEHLAALLDSCATAICSGAIAQLSNDCSQIADILFRIHPFRPSMPKDWDESIWKAVLDAWISGATIHRVTDSVGIAFVQQSIVFQLVWAVEAARTVVEAQNLNPDEPERDERSFLAICLTYGVPNMAAARMLECGMESRVLAVRLAKELDLTFTSRDELMNWMTQLRESEPVEFSDDEREAWQGFIGRNSNSFDQWTRSNSVYEFQLGKGVELDVRDNIRLVPNDTGKAEIYSPDYQWLGRTTSSVSTRHSLVGTIVESDKVSVTHFQPSKLPEWLRAYRAGHDA